MTTQKATIISSSGKRHEVTIHERTADTMTVSVDALPTSGGPLQHVLRKRDGKWTDEMGGTVTVSLPPVIGYDPETGILTVTLEHPPMEALARVRIERVDEMPRGYSYVALLRGDTPAIRCLCGECGGDPLPALFDLAVGMVSAAVEILDADQARLAKMYEAQERRRQAL